MYFRASSSPSSIAFSTQRSVSHSGTGTAGGARSGRCATDKCYGIGGECLIAFAGLQEQNSTLIEIILPSIHPPRYSLPKEISPRSRTESLRYGDCHSVVFVVEGRK